MYNVYCDGTLIYDLYADGLMLIDPVLELELNSPGSFEFSMASDHPYYDLPQKMLSRITVMQDGVEIFCGRVIEETVDFYKTKALYCEGELAFLNDSIQRPAEYHDLSVRDYFKTLIECHNEQVEADKQFEIGIVTVSDDNDSVFRYTNYNSTMEEMKEDLIEDFGGYIRVRNENGRRYLDYIGDINDYGARNDNAIRFGTNLLDYTQDMNASEIATVIIPLGERLEESPIEALDMRLTIESVNGGSDAIESTEAVETYGRIVQTVIWDDVTVASNLLEKGKKYLSDYQFDNMVLEVTAVDLNLINADVETAHLGDMLRVISTPHGLDRYFPLSQMTLHLDSPSENSYTLGSENEDRTLTARVVGTTESIANVEKEITPTQVILNQAKESATNLITAATHGYVVMQPNDEPNEILIMDTADTGTAKRLWRWNLNGLGYSSNGYNGTYGTAITMDGAIVADYITTGTLTANVIKTGKLQDVKGTNSWDMDNGTLTISTKQFTLDSSGNATFSGSLSAASGSFSGTITAASGSTIGGWTLTSGKIYGGTSSTGVAVMQAPSSSITYVFGAGGSSHSSYSDCPFRVDKNGNMYASKGTIGGWTITSSALYYGISSTSSSGKGIYMGTSYTKWQSSSSVYVDISSNGRIEIWDGYDEVTIAGGSINFLNSYEMYLFSVGKNTFTFCNSAGTRMIYYSSSNTRIEIGGGLLVYGDVRYSGSLTHVTTTSLNNEITLLSSDNKRQEEYDILFDCLKPVISKDKSGNESIDLVYSDTVEAIEEAGLDPDKTGIVSEVDGDEGQKLGAINDDELIALLINQVQELKKEVAELKQQIAN